MRIAAHPSSAVPDSSEFQGPHTERTNMTVSKAIPSVEIPAIFCPFMYVCRDILDMIASF